MLHKIFTLSKARGWKDFKIAKYKHIRVLNLILQRILPFFYNQSCVIVLHTKKYSRSFISQDNYLNPKGMTCWSCCKNQLTLNVVNATPFANKKHVYYFFIFLIEKLCLPIFRNSTIFWLNDSFQTTAFILSIYRIIFPTLKFMHFMRSFSLIKAST